MISSSWLQPRKWAVRAALGLWLAAPGIAAAQTVARSAPRPAGPEWGNTQEMVQTIAALAFVPMSSDTAYGWYSDSRYHTADARDFGRFDAAVDIPSGALVTKLEIEGCNDSASDVLRAYLFDCADTGFLCDAYPNNLGVEMAPGTGCFYASAPINLVIDRFNKTQLVDVILEGTGVAVRFRAIRVFYTLQVSPPPATATFGDAPTGHPFFQFVEALVASGITAGCGAGKLLSRRAADARADGGVPGEGPRAALGVLTALPAPPGLSDAALIAFAKWQKKSASEGLHAEKSLPGAPTGKNL